MKTTTKYVCDFCDTAYDTQEMCELCEHLHAPVKQYVAAKYKPSRRYPVSVVIEMNDGHVVEFSFLKDLGEVDIVTEEQEEEPDNDG